MARKLDILVPMYNEGEEVVKPLLDSIAIQQSINLKDDYGVIICCDGGTTVISDEFKAQYPFEIEFYQCEHKGVSATRNACLDHSKAEYVMFCDCDDMFCNAMGLWIVEREMNGNGFETLVSCFVEESRNPQNKQEVMYINHDMDSTFVHGKVHNRKYLINNNIRWNPALTIHEDSYFNCLCQKLASEQGGKYCPHPFYLWKWRDESVCRHDKEYILKTYNNMLDSNTALINEFLDRRKKDAAKFYCAGMIYDAYFTLNKDEWVNQENQNYRHAVEVRFKKYWTDFKKLFNELTKEEKTMIVSGIRQRMYAEGLLMEHQTFDDWIQKVEALEE